MSILVNMANGKYYVVITDQTEEQITLSAVFVSKFLAGAIDAVLGFTKDYIEAATSVFEVDLSTLSITDPVLPWTFDNPFFWTQGVIGEYAPGHWELAFWDYLPRVFVSLGFIDTAPPFLHLSWTYRHFVKRKPSDVDVLPYNAEQFEADGYGIAGSNPSPTGSGVGFRLYQEIIGPPAPGVANAVILDEAVFLHEMGNADLSEYSFEWTPNEPGRYRLTASANMPDGLDYHGNGVFNISAEFSDEILTLYSVVGLYTYYFLDLKAGNAMTTPGRSTRNTNYPVPGVGILPVVMADLLGILPESPIFSSFGIKIADE